MSMCEVSIEGGVLYVVATPIGNLDDITIRAVRVLGQVHCIAAEDTRHTSRLLKHHAIQTPLMALHEHNERQVLSRIVAWLQEGKAVALVSDAGTPLISDPGFPLVRECRRLGLKVSPLPGPAAFVAALSVSGLPTDNFCFHGFLPRQKSARQERLAVLKQEAGTQIFHESSHRIQQTLTDLCELWGGGRKGCVARELTKRYEEVFCGSLSELAQKVSEDPMRRKGEFVILVAPAEEPSELPERVLEVLRMLCQALPLKQAVTLAARITGQKKNQLYREALKLEKKDQA